MPFLALLGFWGIAELVVLIVVFAKLGFFAALGLLILSSAAGSWLLRSQQQAVLRMAETPGRDVARESVYRMTAGVLLLVPGFISSVLALIFLIPPLRALFAGLLLRILPTQTMYSTFSWQQQGNVYEHEPPPEHDVTATREDGSVIHGELLDAPNPNRRDPE